MFRSRQPKKISHRAREILWPSMGLRRTCRYWRHRIVRLKDSNYSIAAGLAVGAAISFTPLPGAHVIGALSLCLLFRLNLIAGLLGTMAGNPWTLPLMWYAAYRVGSFTFNYLGFHVHRMPGHFEWKQLVAEVMHDPMRLFAPWVTGGFILMFLSLPVFYFIFHWVLEHLRATHHLWRKNRLRKEVRREFRIITGQSK